MKNRSRDKVAIIQNEEISGYHNDPPFNPSERFPEYPFSTSLSNDNPIYKTVRNLLIQLKLDKKNIGNSEWNPFKKIIKPGYKVLIKPNFVKHYHNKGDLIESVIVHGSLIRVILDYIYIALKGKGKIIIADTPLEKANFRKICEFSKIDTLLDYLEKLYEIPLELIDLRNYKTIIKRFGRFKKRSLPGDPLGYETIDLEDESELRPLDGENTNYYTTADHSIDHFNPYKNKIGKPNYYHNRNSHKYKVGRSILDSDCVISIAKLKTHKKSGVTLNLKNMIGIIHGKEYIPHHRQGSPPYGDEFPKIPSKLYIRKRNVKRKIYDIMSFNKYLYNFGKKVLKDLLNKRFFKNKYIEEGAWYGNDTLWRTILDINKILLYADKSGKMKSSRQRNYFCFIDGIIGMEGDGPMAGDPINSKLMLAGFNPMSTDVVATRFMGFSPSKIPQFKGTEKYYLGESRIDNIQIIQNNKIEEFKFKPPKGWKNQIEK